VKIRALHRHIEPLQGIKTIRATKDSWDGEYAEDILVDTDALLQPLEHRKNISNDEPGNKNTWLRTRISASRKIGVAYTVFLQGIYIVTIIFLLLK
jgi:hypothetical protein